MSNDKTESQLPIKNIERFHVLNFNRHSFELGLDNSDKMTMQLPIEKLNSLILH